VEWVTSVVRLTTVAIIEAGTLKDDIGFSIGVLRTCLLSSRCSLSLGLLSCPFGRKSTLAFGKVAETSTVVVEPKEELQVLGGVLDVLEVVHEIANGAWLDMR
jgi:hypothetical protein